MGKPTNSIVMMRQCSFKEVITTDGYRLSLVASLRKGARLKGIGTLLGLLRLDTNRTSLDNLSLTHLLGERVVVHDAVNNEGIYRKLCIGLRDYICETLGYTKVKKLLKWNLHIELIVTNSEGEVEYRGSVITITVRGFSTLLKDVQSLRRYMTTQSIVDATNLNR